LILGQRDEGDQSSRTRRDVYRENTVHGATFFVPIFELKIGNMSFKSSAAFSIKTTPPCTSPTKTSNTTPQIHRTNYSPTRNYKVLMSSSNCCGHSRQTIISMPHCNAKRQCLLVLLCCIVCAGLCLVEDRSPVYTKMENRDGRSGIRTQRGVQLEMINDGEQGCPKTSST
jgi:hypothetical protein